MEEIFLGLIVILGVIGGWILGVVGFFSARRALRETATLRRQLAAFGAVPPDMRFDPTPHGPIPQSGPVPPPWARPPADAPEEPPQAPPEEPPEEPAAAPPPPIEDPIPEPAAAPPSAAPPRPPRDLEALLTMRWGIWLGAAALLMAGVFLIRYAVEQEMLGPPVRCALAFLLGGVLIAAAEWMRRHDLPVPGLPADQAQPALAAGGVAVLFGAAYGTGPLYQLVPTLAGFILLAAASLSGLALSLRFGQLVAAVGVAGSFVAPALIETQSPSLPGLFAYLLFVTAAALAVVRTTAWIWLGWATTVAGAAWVVIAAATAPGIDDWAAALFVPASALLYLLLLPPAALDHAIGRRLIWVPTAALGLAGLLLTLAHPADATRAGLLLLGPLTIWKAAAEPRLRRLPWLGAFFYLMVLAGWAVHVPMQPDPALQFGPVVDQQVQWMLGIAALMAGIFAAAGLAMQTRAPLPLAWATLPAAVPVLALAISYARVAMFQTRADWAIIAFLLGAGLIGTTGFSMRGTRPDARQVAGTHAAGAVAALALGCGMLLSDQWLTLAVALFLPALAWIEAKADLPPLRQVAIAVAAFVLIRLLGNWYVLDYAYGGTPILNGLLPTYGVAAAAFAAAAVLFRRRGDDATVGILEAGAVAFATVLVALEIRHFSADGQFRRPYFTFGEAALHVSSMAIMASATMRIATRLGRIVLGYAWRIQGAIALAGALGLVLVNPFFTGQRVGEWPLLDWLAVAYLLPAGLALAAATHPATGQPPGLRRLLRAYALVAVFLWITLEIRHLFHGSRIDFMRDVEGAELWAWSGAWLVYGGALLVLGLVRRNRAIRLAALAIIGLATAKVFLIDMGELTGLWRVLSFLGLGLALIGFGALYRRLAAAPAAPSSDTASDTAPDTAPPA